MRARAGPGRQTPASRQKHGDHRHLPCRRPTDCLAAPSPPFRARRPVRTAGSLFDAKKQPLRPSTSSNGDDKVDVWSYYKDGVEVYREFDTTFKGTPNNFRWLNAGELREIWASISIVNGKAVISVWRYDLRRRRSALKRFEAVASNDFARLQTRC